MDDTLMNGTFSLTSEVGLNHFPRPVTIAAAVCAIIFSIVGVAGKILLSSASVSQQFLPLSINTFLNCRKFGDGDRLTKIHETEATRNDRVRDKSQHLGLDFLRC